MHDIYLYYNMYTKVLPYNNDICGCEASASLFHDAKPRFRSHEDLAHEFKNACDRVKRSFCAVIAHLFQFR